MTALALLAAGSVGIMSSEPLRFDICADIVEAYIERRSRHKIDYQTLDSPTTCRRRYGGVLRRQLEGGLARVAE